MKELDLQNHLQNHHGKIKVKNKVELRKDQRSLSKPTRHKRTEVLSFLLGSDYSPDVSVDRPEDLSCGEGDLVINDVIALLPQMKNSSLGSEYTKDYQW